MIQVQFSGDALEIEMRITPSPGYEGDLQGFDLIRRAIVEMIESFDTHFLEKEVGYAETNHFYSSVLGAVARHYMVDDDADRQLTVQVVLLEMIENLAEGGLLQEIVVNDPDN
jgi:hypothetical protein